MVGSRTLTSRSPSTTGRRAWATADWRGIPLYIWGIIAAAFIVRLAFWIYTDRVWEDSLITLAAVRNAFTPTGLTHHPGEGHVYSVTSALFVLIPLIGEVIHRGAGGVALRSVSLVGGSLAVLFTFLICRRLGLGRWSILLATVYVAVDHEEIFYGMSGMDTQVATTILLASVFFVLRGDTLWSGLTFGLAMLARPDFILWVAPAVAYMLWKRGLPEALRAAGLAALLFAPWLVFTQLYYGTIIPETILAKAVVFSPVRLILGTGGLGPADWISNAFHLYGTDLTWFSPFYEGGAVTRAPLPLALGMLISLFVLVLAVQGAWRTRHVPGWLPAIAYAALFVVYRVFFLGAAATFGWYLPPFRAMVIVLAAAGLARFVRVFPRFGPVFACGLAALFALSSVMLFPLDKRAQEIENAVRIEAGRFLGRDANPSQTVVSESSGYVGYYSAARLEDYPGLTSPTSYHVLASAPPRDRSLVYLIATLRPDYAVLRPAEKTYLGQRYPDLASQYRVVATFHSDLVLDNWGIAAESIDRTFYIVRRS
jgi:hypothetical protein